MTRYLISRFLQSLLALVCTYTITFWLLQAAPGNPFLSFKEKAPPPAVLKALNERYSIDRPWVAYFQYPWRALRHGDLGPTIQYENWTVTQIIVNALPVSVSLGALALLIALWLGVIGGTLGAMYK